jgi:signal transduction histidine kinase/HAMP domain-containing protein
VGKYALEVTTAEVSLGAVLKAVSQIEVGPGGYAYVVDSRNHLVAHPDSRVMRDKRDLSALAQVKSARADRSGSTSDASALTVAEGLGGGRMLAAHAEIAPLGWMVFIERPAADAYAPLRAPIIRSVIIFVLGLGLSVLASLLLARRMVAPIRVLQEGATRIGAGTLDQPIELRTGDEIEALAESFNSMAASLKESYEGLEQKVEARTRELADANRDLTEALEQQTATSDLLRVISSSPTDVQPVFDAIAHDALRLCEATTSVIGRYDGEFLHIVAHDQVRDEGVQAMLQLFPMRPSRATAMSRAVLERAVVHLPDVLEDLDYARPVALSIQNRSTLAVPMLRDGQPIGTISVGRLEPRPFTDKQISLLQTFADQAVIAIENVRLFKELEARTRELTRSVDRLTALGDVGRAVSSSLDLEQVLTTIVSRAVQISGMDAGAIYEYDEPAEVFHLRATEGLPDEFLESAPVLRKGEGVTGQLAVMLAPVQIPDISVAGAYQSRARDVLLSLGLRAAFAVPLLHEGRVVGGLAVNRRVPGEFPQDIVDLLQTFATQSALAIQNARLFREIEEKSRQLELASKHKSQFLANMSHELRTPMNAVLGYTDLILDNIFGDVPEAIRDTLERVKANGQHLLGLINDVLDLSKIEAGQLTLSVADYSMGEIVQAVVSAVESLAAEKKLALKAMVPADLPPGRGDERRLTQVLLNLAGNAIKFTDEGGVSIEARISDGAFVVSVSDTGPGISEADRQTIFEEFQQADSSSTRKKGGTGLGLSISRRIVELHGGRLWMESAVGVGSTFHFTVPLRAERQPEKS